MKTLLRLLKNFWFLVVALWLASLVACWFAAPRLSWLDGHAPEALAIVSAFFGLIIVLRQYRRIRAEQNLENLVQLEVDRSLNATGEFRDQQVLRERLKHAIAMLRTDRAAGGGGSSALYDLPWYLVIGMSSAGKTSLLTRSGLSASIASSTSDSGTQHCDWYFSPEAVMVDTAGRYLQDDQSASEFTAFLKMVKKQRGNNAINGLVLVVSLPELLSASTTERQQLASQLVTRIDEYTDCLQASPPIYLMLSKADQLPGFEQAFENLDLHERQQPLGITFGLNEIRTGGLHAVLSARMQNLHRHLRSHVDAQCVALGAKTSSSLLSFPNYMRELSVVLEQFLQPFTRDLRNDKPLLLRGLYFTSALQTDQKLSQVYDDHLCEQFALRHVNGETSQVADESKKTGERSYFITDTFRRVIFPDRELTRHQSRTGRHRLLGPAALTTAVLAGLLFMGWEAWSFHNNRQLLDNLRQPLTDLEQSPERDQQLTSGQGLELLRGQLMSLEAYRAQGVPLKLSGGLYQGDDLYEVVHDAYLRELRTRLLEPVTRQLQVQMRELNEFASTMDANSPVTGTRPQRGTSAQLKSKTEKLLGQASGNVAAVKAVPASPGALVKTPANIASRVTGTAKDAVRQSGSQTMAALRNPATLNDAAELSATTGGLSLSEEMLGRLDEQQVASIIESYNALKLYLLLTQPGVQQQADFVSAALPALWSDTAPTEGRLSDQAMQDNTAAYVRLLRSGKAPQLPRNEQLISITRASLKSFMISSSLVDREYLRLQLESSRQFPALSLANMVPLAGRRVIYGKEVVPAIYTREGWEEFVKPELIKLVSKDLHNESDWVLDGEGGDHVVQKANFVRDFMTRYKRDYATAWYALIGSAGIRHFTDLQNATEQLSLLSDVQNSPIKLILSAVHENTQWDVPVTGETPQPGVKQNDGFWSRVTGIFDARDASPVAQISPLPPIEDGSLAKRFEAISRLFAEQNAEGADSTIMDRYLATLRQLKVRMTNIQRSQDVGKSSKQLISETLEGQPSEIASVRNYVETSVDTSQGGLSTSLLSLFSLPVQFAWETLRAPASEQVAKAWDQQVAKPWDKVMAHRYPISADSRNETSIKDLQRFVDPQSGLLSNFKRNEIGNLSGGEGLGMAGAAKTAPLVNPRMINSIDTASSVGEVIASLSDRENGFEIMLEPSANFTDIIFTLDGQEQHYRNGKTSWNRFTWPGESMAPGARLEVITLSGQRITVFDHQGRWGLLRMTDSARVYDLDGIQQRFSWNTAAGQVRLSVRNYGGVKLTDLANVKALSSLNSGGGAQ